MSASKFKRIKLLKQLIREKFIILLSDASPNIVKVGLTASYIKVRINFTLGTYDEIIPDDQKPRMRKIVVNMVDDPLPF